MGGPICTNCVNGAVSGPKIRKKVWSALEGGRKEAIENSEDLDSFLQNWINGTIVMISQGSQGHPQGVMEEDIAVQLFSELVVANAIPLALSKETGLPEGWEEVLTETVKAAYVLFTATEGEEGGAFEAGAGP